MKKTFKNIYNSKLIAKFPNTAPLIDEEDIEKFSSNLLKNSILLYIILIIYHLKVAKEVFSLLELYFL